MRTEKARYLEGKRAHPFPLCSFDMAKLSVPRFSHMWKTHLALQDFKDYHRKAVAACKDRIKSIRIMSKPLTFSKHPKHNNYCTADFLFGNEENIFFIKGHQ